MKEAKIGAIVEKRIKTIKWGYYLELKKKQRQKLLEQKNVLKEELRILNEQNKEREKFYKSEVERINSCFTALNNEQELITWHSILEQPVSEEFRLQIEQQVKAELGLVKEEPKSLLTAEQEAQLAQLIEQGESGSSKEKFF